MWEGIRSIINVKNEKSSNNISLNIDNETITDDLTISNHFNNFFTSVAKNLVNKIPKTPKSFNSCLKNSNENSFFLSLTTEEDFENILSTLKTNKRAEPGSVPTRIPKDFKKCLSKPVSNLINLPFSLGTFPKILKQAKVISIFKKGDQQNCNNYRPISLLSNISKIIEKLIHKQLSVFLEINNCLYTHQYGFRNQHSTTHALITITEKVRHALDNDKITCRVFLDLQKAFDTVDHQIIKSLTIKLV